MSESKTPMYKNDYGIVVRGYESRLGGLYKSEDVALRAGKETDPVHALVRFADVVHAFVDLKAATYNEVAAWSLVADIREALGDNGKRMQTELIEWCNTLASAESDLAAAVARAEKAEADTKRALSQFDDALGRLQQAHEQRDALAARVEQAEADARRWRFVRGKVSRILNERTLNMDGLRVEVYYDEPQAFLIVPTDNGALFDEAIDAALAREEKS